MLKQLSITKHKILHQMLLWNSDETLTLSAGVSRSA